jgi:lipopolysaccharide transport protein LptA
MTAPGPAVLLALALGLAAVTATAAPGATTGAAAQEPARALALEGAGGTLTVNADRMAFSNQTGVLGFTGNVRVDRNGMRMQARHVTVTLERDGSGAEKRRIHNMVAEGDVTFTYGDRTATAGRAEYDPAAGTVVLTEKPKVTEPTMTVVGKRITIDLTTQESTVEGGAFTFTEGK